MKLTSTKSTCHFRFMVLYGTHYRFIDNSQKIFKSITRSKVKDCVVRNNAEMWKDDFYSQVKSEAGSRCQFKMAVTVCDICKLFLNLILSFETENAG